MIVSADESPGHQFDCPWCPLVMEVWHSGMMAMLIDTHMREHTNVLVTQIDVFLSHFGGAG